MPQQGELLAHLLARQRAVFVDSGASAVTAVPRPVLAAGTSVIWARLCLAMQGLLDVEREVLFLSDGAACSEATLAQSLGCGVADIRDLLCTGRAELITQLQLADEEGSGPSIARHLPVGAFADDIAFIRHLNIALYQALQGDIVDPARRRVLCQMIAHQSGQLALPQVGREPGGDREATSRMTSWLRLMYVAYTQSREAMP